jgi:hypothetical protein
LLWPPPLRPPRAGQYQGITLVGHGLAGAGGKAEAVEQKRDARSAQATAAPVRARAVPAGCRGRTAVQRGRGRPAAAAGRVRSAPQDEARQARRLLADAKLHGHKYAIDAVLAVIARQQKGQVTVFTSDVDDLHKLVPESIVVKKV